jgi:hypothetical protein
LAVFNSFGDNLGEPEMWQKLESSLLKLAQIGQSRSSVINPLQWTLVILLFGILALVGFRAPEWVLICFVGVFVVTFFLLGYAYVFFMYRNPAALRSEKYSLAQQFIERKLIGDSQSGTMIVDFDRDTELPIANGLPATDIQSKHE